jgi:hypothetical protein
LRSFQKCPGWCSETSRVVPRNVHPAFLSLIFSLILALLSAICIMTTSLNFDPFSLDSLRLPTEALGSRSTRKALPRHKPGDPFIKGPIAYAWITLACRLTGSGLSVTMAFRFYANRFRYKRRGIRWGLVQIADGLRVSFKAAQRGLRAAEIAGLVSVSRQPGHKITASTLDLPVIEGAPKRKPLIGPIPWSWWLPASQLPGRALQVAVICWLLAGWERSAEFQFVVEDWAEFGLSRSSASRGLQMLERAGLVSVVRTQGKSPTVTLC